MSEINQRIIAFLKDCGAFYYATVDGDAARVRPFGFVMEFNDRIYFGMGSHKECYRQTIQNPNVEVCACKDGKFIRIRGKAVFDDSPEQIAAYEATVPAKMVQAYKEHGWYHANCYLEDMHAEIQGMDGTFEKLC